MKKLLFALLLIPSLAFAQGIIPSGGGSGGGPPTGAAGGVLSGTYPNPGFATSPTFTGTVTHPTPFTLGAVSVTTTGTQLNFLSAATGTTGTTSTNIVFSTSPSIATPTITGSFTATGLVTNASLASMSTTTIKGQSVGGSGAPIDLTATQAAAIIGSVGGALKSNTVFPTRDLTTATGTQAITGMGFQPTSCHGSGQVTASLAQYITIRSVSDSVRNTQVTSVFSSTISSAGGAGGNFFVFGDTSGLNFNNASIQSYDADGLTLSWTKSGTPTGTASLNITCYR